MEIFELKVFSARMGNKMFKYSTARGLAEKFGAKAIVPASFYLLKVFNLTAVVAHDRLYNRIIALNRNRVKNQKVNLILF